MTDHQKSLIDTMRYEGYGSVKIVQTIGVSENNVKSGQSIFPAICVVQLPFAG